MDIEIFEHFEKIKERAKELIDIPVRDLNKEEQEILKKNKLINLFEDYFVFKRLELDENLSETIKKIMYYNYEFFDVIIEDLILLRYIVFILADIF